MSLDGRDINELRVVDLKVELEKRGLDKSGNKQVLLERLQKAIDEDTKVEDVDEDETVIDEDNSGTEVDETPVKIENKTCDVLVLDTSLETDKKINMEVKVAENKAIQDIATKEDTSMEEKKQEDVEADNGSGVFDQDTVGKEEMEHEEPLQVVQEKMAIKEEGDKDIDADVEVSMDVEDKIAESTADEEVEISGITTTTSPAATANVTANGTEEKPAPAAKDTRDGKKDVDLEKTSTASPSKIKERLVHDQNRNLWITNISQTTRATELKQALSEHGKVVGAKVVINARHPAACCYGYVRMETVADADNCIAKLNNTELNGQIIRIEKVRPDHLNPNAKAKPEIQTKEKPSQRTPVRAPTPAKEETKKDRKPIEAPPKDDKKDNKSRSTEDRKSTNNTALAMKPSEKDKDKDSRDSKENNNSKERPKGRRSRSRSRDKDRSDAKPRSISGRGDNRATPRHNGPPSRREVPAVRKEKDILTFDKIKTERERERLREREREMRMRRREESERVKEIERRQRSEEARLERERQKIKEERERLERERSELLALERERQKREREKIELERLELQRAKMRMQEEERRAVKRPAPSGFRERERSYEERKRSVPDRHFQEAPPPPRFDAPSSIKAREASPQMKKFSSSSSSSKDYKRLSYEKRDSYPPKRDYDERTHSSSMSGRNSGSAPVPKYESSSSNYSRDNRDRDMRTASDPRSSSGGGVRSSNSSGMGGSVSSSKYPSESSKVRYSDRERERSPHYNRSSSMRDDREQRRPAGDTKSAEMRSSRSDHRYPEPKVDSVRYDRASSSSSASWSQHKNFPPTNTAPSKPWNKDVWRSSEGAPSSGDRWSTNTSRPSMAFSNNQSMNLGPSCPPPPGINTYVNDRFDYKSNMNTMRKY